MHLSLNSTPSADRIHIGIFGMRNAGKSSIINAITGQPLAIVSDIRGTTTDPVSKAMELLPLGPVVIIDTPGLDDEGELGALRIQKAYQVLNKTDIAVLVIDASVGRTAEDDRILERIQKKKIPFVIVYNKADRIEIPNGNTAGQHNTIYVSSKTGYNIPELKELIASQLPTTEDHPPIVGDLIQEGAHVILVVPIDKGAPKGRLILPQQQTIRDILDHHAFATVTQPDRLSQVLHSFTEQPALVVTDSQVFSEVAKDVPEDIPMTSFSILFARYKGNL